MKAEYASINTIKGIGKKYVEVLNDNGIFTIKDLFLAYPYRYESFIPTDLYNITNYNKVCLVGNVISTVTYQFHRNNLNSLTFNMLSGSRFICFYREACSGGYIGSVYYCFVYGNNYK